MSSEVVTREMLTTVTSRQQAKLKTMMSAHQANVDDQIKQLEARLSGMPNEQFDAATEIFELKDKVSRQLDAVTRQLTSDSQVMHDHMSSLVSQMRALREDVDKVKSSNTASQMLALRQDVEELKSKQDAGISPQPWPSPMAHSSRKADMAQDFVTLEKHAADVEELRREIQLFSSKVDEVAVKAGYLAVAASEYSRDEKAQIFTSLKEKEQSIAMTQSSYLATHKTLGADLTFGSIAETKSLEVIELDRRYGAGLGLEVDGHNGETLVIEGIHDGLMKEWNEANKEKAIRPGDLILQVDDVRGSSLQLLQAIKSVKKLQLFVQRCG